ncbi:bis(5'-nucleosyl)-tetraphosphatase [Luminiphilus syltensis NOR5-1B]|uniref:bis(5'-nucleosyl)-tetraphosphatase (symmetrical) n=1 Tax=Luminiphilus syltensis NOR5-1B TaxID=565045 RepID=B8KVX8_9GAMM|nr:symmetrical bis(5'-nucleosyl)-tetraphosphatase [Luminiphilus syltensis]EED36505.1 bis(5'-nucleosyl)-tetraphosphatase [Luminiphilus syltensis NOR5-1B]
MTHYAVGDIQGCLRPLKKLLKQVGFNPKKDHLWSTGDLVNRGPENLASLRWFHDHRDSVTVVLGNHDLHLLAIAANSATHGRSDNLQDILDAPDRDTLLHWLRHQPLLHRGSLPITNEQQTYGAGILVHAGIPPVWTSEQAAEHAREVETVLRGPDYRQFLKAMYGNEPYVWSDHLKGMARLRVITNYLTRMRYCSRRAKLDFVSKEATPRVGALSGKTVNAWFAQPNKLEADECVVFGHWAALSGVTQDHQFIGLDTGCVWGGCMTLMNLQTGARHTAAC